LVLYGLLDSGLTIVQILAVSLFVMLLVIPGFAPYMGEVLRGLEGKTFQEMMREQWLYTLVWTILLGWGALAMLAR
jgi:1,4-dihydroxy-2-naphthoate octaprenyltransferase